MKYLDRAWHVVISCDCYCHYFYNGFLLSFVWVSTCFLKEKTRPKTGKRYEERGTWGLMACLQFLGIDSRRQPFSLEIRCLFLLRAFAEYGTHLLWQATMALGTITWFRHWLCVPGRGSLTPVPFSTHTGKRSLRALLDSDSGSLSLELIIHGFYKLPRWLGGAVRCENHTAK